VPRYGRLINQSAADHRQGIAGGIPILALDMYEHAYHIEYGANTTAYIAAFMRNIDWTAVEVRYGDAVKVAPPRPLSQPAFADMPSITSEEVQAMLASGQRVQIRPRLAHQCNHGRKPPSRHWGTGIGPDRDITGSWRDVVGPCASLPAVPPGRARAPRGNCRLFDKGKRNLARDGLFAGKRWIRALGPPWGRRMCRQTRVCHDQAEVVPTWLGV
jgi:hypothetical protein